MTSRYLLLFFHQFHITVRSLYNRPTTLYLMKCGPYSRRKFWNYDLGNENMTVNSRYITWMNNIKKSLCNTLLALMCFLPHSNDMTSWQSSSAEKVSCNVAPFFYHHSVVIQHLVSDRLLSLISKENMHNVR